MPFRSYNLKLPDFYFSVLGFGKRLSSSSFTWYRTSLLHATAVWERIKYAELLIGGKVKTVGEKCFSFEKDSFQMLNSFQSNICKMLFCFSCISSRLCGLSQLAVFLSCVQEGSRVLPGWSGDNTNYTQEREFMLGDNAARCGSSSATTHSDDGEEKGPDVLWFANMTMA